MIIAPTRATRPRIWSIEPSMLEGSAGLPAERVRTTLIRLAVVCRRGDSIEGGSERGTILEEPIDGPSEHGSEDRTCDPDDDRLIEGPADERRRQRSSRVHGGAAERNAREMDHHQRQRDRERGMVRGTFRRSEERRV